MARTSRDHSADQPMYRCRVRLNHRMTLSDDHLLSSNLVTQRNDCVDHPSRSSREQCGFSGLGGDPGPVGRSFRLSQTSRETLHQLPQITDSSYTRLISATRCHFFLLRKVTLSAPLHPRPLSSTTSSPSPPPSHIPHQHAHTRQPTHGRLCLRCQQLFIICAILGASPTYSPNPLRRAHPDRTSRLTRNHLSLPYLILHPRHAHIRPFPTGQTGVDDLAPSVGGEVCFAGAAVGGA